jgi:hypothetical protein
VLLALLFAMVALAATLWRRTWLTVVLVIAASAAAAGAFAWWGARQPAVRVAFGGVNVRDGRVIRYDRWDYLRSLRPRALSRPWLTSQKPIFASASQTRDLDLRLNCDASGQPTSFTWRGQPGETLAFLIRSVDANPGPPTIVPSLPVTSPMLALVESGYLSDGATVAGQIGPDEPQDDADGSETWPSVSVLLGSR